MSWGSKAATTALTLTSSYQTVQESAADKEWTLNPGEVATLILDVDLQATPTEDADIIVVRSVDGTEYESDGEAEQHVLGVSNRESDDPVERHIVVAGCHTFKVRARTRDTDDTAGGDDSGTTLTVHYRLDGVSL